MPGNLPELTEEDLRCFINLDFTEEEAEQSLEFSSLDLDLFELIQQNDSESQPPNMANPGADSFLDNPDKVADFLTQLNTNSGEILNENKMALYNFESLRDSQIF